MVSKERVGATAARRARPLNYFYLNGLLHKKLHINRGLDEITAWCYPTGRRVTYPYQMTKQRLEPAFTMTEVSRMLNRQRSSIMNALRAGDIERPQFTYALNESRRKFKYLWHEKNIIDAHAYFSNVHRGRPRLDGKTTPQHLPTLAELRAMIRQQEILYVKVGDEFRPTWNAPEL